MLQPTSEPWASKPNNTLPHVPKAGHTTCLFSTLRLGTPTLSQVAIHPVEQKPLTRMSHNIRTKLNNISSFMAARTGYIARHIVGHL